MSEYVVQLIANYGYFGMFLSMILEAVIIIIPSELILATGGILAADGIFSFRGAFLTGLLGSVFCAIAIYLMGYFGGRPFVRKYGKYFFMKEEDLDTCDHWMNRYGLLAALIGRNFPIVRTLISFPMGVARVSFFKFVLFTTIGSIPWTFAFVYVGYVLKDNWTILQDYTSSMKTPIRLLLFALFLYYLYRKQKKARNG